MTHKSESDLIEHSHNTARFFTENRQIAFILLLGVFVWGWYGFQKMPKRKDPSIPIRVAVASTQWPGATAQEVEQLVSRPIEQTMAQNSFVRPPAASDFGIRSLSFPGLSLVYIQLDDSVKDTKKQFSDINLKLDSISSRLPQGAGPIQFNSDFGDTSALMLTVASPPATRAEIAVASSCQFEGQSRRSGARGLPLGSLESAWYTRFRNRLMLTWFEAYSSRS